MIPIKCHYCKGDDCFVDNFFNQNNSCFSNTGKCFTSVDLHAESYQHQRGCVHNDLFCLSPKQQQDNIITDQSNADKQYYFSNGIDAYIRCCTNDFCNDENFIEFPKISKINEYDEDNLNDFNYQQQSIWKYLLLLILLISLTLTLYYFMRTIKRYLLSKSNKNENNHRFDLEKLHYSDGGNCNNQQQQQLLSSRNDSKKMMIQNNNNCADNKLLHDYDQSYSSGSGYGESLLSQRTIAKQITLIQCVGKGRYGEVWKGLFHFEAVAVKKFLSRDEASYNREIEIYTLSNLNKHENILTFIGADVISENSCTRLWLITDYHELGSLFDFLSQNILSFNDMFSIMLSIASGLTYLHTENFGTKKKVAIAHRDIKSKNILMKTHNVCCIADFGLAVTKQKTGHLDIGRNNYRVGTKRYMAPEVLDDSFVKDNFTAYTQADIYSFGLVLWEILRRIDLQPILNYEVPYQFMVPSDPSFDDMRKIVCVDQYRPEIPAHLEMNEKIPILQSICKIIRESWAKNPSSRLTVLRIKKSLLNLVSQMDNMNEYSI